MADDWNLDRDGRPDVIAFLKAESDVEKIEQRTFSNNPACYADLETRIPVFDDYIAALDYRDKFLKQIKCKNFTYQDALDMIISNKFFELKRHK